MPLVSRTFDQLFNFTRTSAATFVGSNGLVQVTPASVNLLTFTQEFDNAAWNKAAGSVIVTANSTTAPDGTPTADTITESTGTSTHNIYNGFTSVSGSTYAWSGYVKANGRTIVQLSCQGTGLLYVPEFDLVALTTVTRVGSGTATITAVGDGWLRITAVTAATGSGTGYWQLNLCSAANTSNYTGNGTSGVFLWGAQVELGATATTYTRNFGGLFPPRLDYNPVTLLPRGLLVEQQVTNLLLRSEEFDNAYWTASGVTVTANTSVSPGGATTADTIDDGLTTGLHRVFRSPITTTAAAQTFSCYVKAGTGVWFQLTAFDGVTSYYANFNVSTGVVGNKSAAATSSMVSMGNGWYRCIMTATTAATAAGNFQLVAMDADTAIQTPSFTGANRTWFVWGAQHEVLPFASSYIPTVASQVTRTSDQTTISAPNFASWYNSPEGTLFVEFSVLGINTVSETLAMLSDNTANNILLPFVNSGGTSFVNVISGGVTSANLSTGAVTVGAVSKHASAYLANGFAATLNGAAPTIDSAGAVPVGVNTLNAGWSAPYGGLFLNGHIRSIRYYPIRLSNTALQALTA